MSCIYAPLQRQYKLEHLHLYVNAKVMLALIHNPQWKQKLQEAHTPAEVKTVIIEYAKSAGYKIIEHLEAT